MCEKKDRCRCSCKAKGRPRVLPCRNMRNCCRSPIGGRRYAYSPQQPCNRSGFGNSSISSGKGSPRTSRAGRPLRSSKLRSTPASTAAVTRRDITDLSSFNTFLMSACLTSSLPSASRSTTALTVSRTSGLIVTSAPSAAGLRRHSPEECRHLIIGSGNGEDDCYSWNDETYFYQKLAQPQLSAW
jgi:hypothetical protein